MSIENLINNVKKELNHLNILVNNAGFVGTSELTGWNTTFEKQSVESWRRAFEVNLTAVFELCQGFAPIMKDSIGSSIVNISSIYGLLGPDWRLYAETNMGNPAAYGASKGALIQFTRWLSTTLAPSVRVNAICPGGIFRNQPESFVSQYEQRTPMARMAKEEDFKVRHGLDDIELVECFLWTEAEFIKYMEGSAILRIGYDQWLRNIAIGLGNAKTSETIVNALKGRLNEASPLVKEHISWALAQHNFHMN